MKIRDRIKELRRVEAGRLKPHPKNWRTHPKAQQDALRGILAEVGYADALVARELPDGSLELIDGHLRAETTPDMKVPVLIVDLSDEEAATLLAIHDPLAAMAEADRDILADLFNDVETENEALQSLMSDLLAEPELPQGFPSQDGPPPEVEVPEAFQVVVECADEDQQQSIYQRMTDEGFKCRLLTL